jgi:hypothetical protein
MPASDAPDLTAVRASAVLLWIVAAGFGLPAPLVARHLLEHRELPMFFDLFRMYGGGFSERFSPETFAILLAVFAGLSVVEAFAGWMLWNGARAGGVLALALLPFEIAFWVGFAVPFPPLFAIVRLGLLAAGWGSLR